MTEKARKISELASETTAQLTRSYGEWTAFLRVASRLYKDVCCKRWKEDFTQYSIAAGSFVVKPTICRF